MTLKTKKKKVTRTNPVTYQVSNSGGVLSFTENGRKIDRLPVGILTTKKGLVNPYAPAADLLVELLAEKRNRSTEGIALEFDAAAQELLDYLDGKYTPGG